MKFMQAGRWMAAVSLIGLAASAAAAQDAAAIMKRAEQAIQNARTYQAVWQMTTSMGQMGSMTMKMEIKKSGNKTAMKMSPVGQPTGMMAMGATMANMQMVDDGKTSWVYLAGMNGYMKQPSQASNRPNPAQMMGIGGQEATYKLLRTEQVGGKPAYVIQVIPKNANDPRLRNMQNLQVLAYVDKATGRTRQMRMSGTMSGPQGQSQPMNINMIIQNEQVNVPIPDSVFKFTPPTGAKQMKGGMGMPGPGMAPGGGRP